MLLTVKMALKSAPSDISGLLTERLDFFFSDQPSWTYTCYFNFRLTVLLKNIQGNGHYRFW